MKIARKENIEYMNKLRDKMIKKILEKIPYTKLNGPTGARRLCNNINISFKAIEAKKEVGTKEVGTCRKED